MKPSKINFTEKFSKLPDEDYSVRIIAKMNDYEFKIVKFKGEFSFMKLSIFLPFSTFDAKWG